MSFLIKIVIFHSYVNVYQRVPWICEALVGDDLLHQHVFFPGTHAIHGPASIITGAWYNNSFPHDAHPGSSKDMEVSWNSAIPQNDPVSWDFPCNKLNKASILGSPIYGKSQMSTFSFPETTASTAHISLHNGKPSMRSPALPFEQNAIHYIPDFLHVGQFQEFTYGKSTWYMADIWLMYGWYMVDIWFTLC